MPKRGKTTVVMADIAAILDELRRENVDALGKKSILPPPEEDQGELAREIERLKQQMTLDEIEPGTGTQRWIKLWDKVDALLPELVSLAEVPAAGYRGFCLAVHDRMLKFIGSDRSAFRDEAMLEVERRLRTAQDAILALSQRQRGEVNQAILHHSVHEADPASRIHLPYDQWDRVIPNILAGIAKITGSARYRSADPSRPGPKQKERISVKVRDFIRDLWSIAQAHGGKFSVTSEPDPVGSGTHAVGTIVDALRLLEPVLPPGFVSPMPSASTLNRCRPEKK
jgi:hypothetical protein